MTSAELLVDAFGRIGGAVHRVVDGLTPEQLTFQVDPEANSIAWLVWHLTRIQDDHLAEVAGAGAGLDLPRLGGAVRVAVRPPGQRLRAPSR
jgi:hypothetical protein